MRIGQPEPERAGPDPAAGKPDRDRIARESLNRTLTSLRTVLIGGCARHADAGVWDDADFEDFGPQLAGDEEAIAGRIVSDPVQHVGTLRLLALARPFKSIQPVTSAGFR